MNEAQSVPAIPEQELVGKGLGLTVGRIDNRVAIEFSREVRRLGFSRGDAIAFANAIKTKALLCK